MESKIFIIKSKTFQIADEPFATSVHIGQMKLFLCVGREVWIPFYVYN